MPTSKKKQPKVTVLPSEEDVRKGRIPGAARRGKEKVKHPLGLKKNIKP
jgi:hypothetical protein